MITYTPTPITSGFNVTDINTNFTAIQNALKYALNTNRNTDNTMNQALDMASNNISNAATITCTELTVGGISVAAQAAAAAASAAAALTSENNAATSASNASTSASNASTYASNASASATLAQDWATSAAIVASTDYSSKEYAIGTTIRGSIGSAKDWATYTAATVDGSEYSAKYYAQAAAAIVAGDQLSVGTGAPTTSKVNAHSNTAIDTYMQFTNLNTGDTINDGLFVGIQANQAARFWLKEAQNIYIGANNTQIARFTSAGDFNLGTNTTGERLRVHEEAVIPVQIQFTNSTTTDGSGAGFKVGIASDGTAALINSSNTDTFFSNNGSSGMRLSAAGDLILYEGATPRTVWEDSPASGYAQGGMPVIANATGINATEFDVDAVIGAAWESVGPTGSGATNIWATLDSVPTDARFVILRVHNQINGATNAALYYNSLYARKNGDATAANIDTLISTARFINRSGLDEADANITTVIVPINTSTQVFDLYLTTWGTTPTANVSISLVGWL